MVFLGSTSFQTPSLEISTDPLPLKKKRFRPKLGHLVTLILPVFLFTFGVRILEERCAGLLMIGEFTVEHQINFYMWKTPPSIWHLINFRWSFPRRSSPSFPIVHHVPSMRIQELRIPPVERTWKNRETGGVTHRIWGTPVSDKAIWTSY